MSKRLQVVVDDAELRAYEELARARGLTTSEWVRGALRDASRESSLGDVDQRVRAIRSAASHTFPAPDIAQMLAEIERGHDATATE